MVYRHTFGFRHVVVNSTNKLSKEDWGVVAHGVAHAATLVLNPLVTLNSVFSHNCHMYYGDVAHIKVAARKDSSMSRNLRLRHLAQQVSIQIYTV